MGWKCSTHAICKHARNFLPVTEEETELLFTPTRWNVDNTRKYTTESGYYQKIH